jgi:N-glycosylase/DNA lyase
MVEMNRAMSVYEREIDDLYTRVRDTLESRLLEFRQVWERGDESEILGELLFCLLTPAARARAAWQTLNRLRQNGLILRGDGGLAEPDERMILIARELNTVRFKNNKARNIVLAERRFTGEGNPSIRTELLRFHTPQEMREWLVPSIRGIGYKEASHFLRNIGFYEDIAILDRHILRNLMRLGIVERVPEGLSRKQYLHVEGRMRALAKRLRIPLHHLDLVLWYRETGEIFK